ncbi:DNA topoisomerase [Halalkalibacter sp. AB-rgal2]|uniref:DNA topoisomerase n=1 Tax=Halalkalibacter sp. AB-rgal2 TaxID=3242695 RepID=UPI00359D2F4D
MKVIIAEKPSVARNIADALQIKGRKDGYYEGNGYIITWAYGHLLELYDVKDYDEEKASWKLEYFPFIPPTFQYKVKKDRRQGSYTQFMLIKRLISRTDVAEVISACDYDREGQLIADTILLKIGSRKKVYRLLLNEWTGEEVRAGLLRLKDNSELSPLRDAGLSRQWADWLLGINLTSVATLCYQKGARKGALNVGRVLMPTLKIIYDRDQEIAQFQPEDYYKLKARCQTANNDHFEADYYLKSNTFKERSQLDHIAGLLQGKRAKVVKKDVKQKKEYAPLLFNLTHLQGYITSKYRGWTSDKVLKVAQQLYEKKWITYPRTSSVALDESLKQKAEKVLQTLKAGLSYEHKLKFHQSKRVFNNAKVESHSAIIPTYVIPKSFTQDEKIVYEAIRNRFLMQFMPIATYEETVIKLVPYEQVDGFFRAKGKVQLEKGWKEVEDDVSKDVMLPLIHENEDVLLQNVKVEKKQTKPPKPHTEKTLLKVMETCGKHIESSKEGQEENEWLDSILSGYSIGTPATRADTIKKLKKVGYITFKEKNITCTELGKKLVETLPIKELFDLHFTGRLEKALSEIEKNRLHKDVFLTFITKLTGQMVDRMKQSDDVVIKQQSPSLKTNETLGACPRCNHQVIEGKKGFGCSNWKSGCTFVIWKNDRYLAALNKKPTKTMVKSILKHGEAKVKGLKSKKGKSFSAILKYEWKKEEKRYGWTMKFEQKSNQ